MLAMLKYVPGVLTKKISMQELRPLLNAEVAPYITKLSVHKIHKIINGFGEAAVLAVRAGFDMVQIHSPSQKGLPHLLAEALFLYSALPSKIGQSTGY